MFSLFRKDGGPEKLSPQVLLGKQHFYDAALSPVVRSDGRAANAGSASQGRRRPRLK